MSITANTPTFTASPLGNYQIVSAQYQSTDTTRIYPSLWREVRSYRNNKLLSKKRIRNWGSTATTNQITRTYNDYNGRKDGSTDGTYCQYRLIVYSNSARTKVAKQSSLSSALYSPPAAPADGDLKAAITTTSLTAKWANPNMGSSASKTDAFATVTLYDADGVQVDSYTSSDYTERSYTFTGLTANTEYYFTVQYSVSSIGSSRVARSKIYVTTPLAPLQPTGISCGIVGGGRELPAVGTGSVYCTWQYNSADGSPQTGASGTTQAGAWSVADDTNYLTFPVSSGGVIDPSYLTPRVDGSGYDFTFTLSDVSSAGGTTAVGTTVTLFIPNTLTVTDNTDATATGLPLVFDVDTPLYDFVTMEVSLSIDGEIVASIPPTAVTHYAESGSTRSYKVEMGADVFVPANLTTYDYAITVTTPYGTSAEVTGTITTSFAQPDAPTVAVTEADGYAVEATIDIAGAFNRTISNSGDGTASIDVTLPAELVGEPFVKATAYGNITGAEDITVTHNSVPYTLPSCLLFYYDVDNSDYIEADSSDVTLYQTYYQIGKAEYGDAFISGSSVNMTWFISGSGWQNTPTVSATFWSPSIGNANYMFRNLDLSLVDTDYSIKVSISHLSTYATVNLLFHAASGVTASDIATLANDLIIAAKMNTPITQNLGASSLPALIGDETYTFAASSTEQPQMASVTYLGTTGVENASLYRIVDGERVMVASGISDEGVVYDYTPPLNTEIEYVAVTTIYGVPSVDSEPAVITVTGGNALVNYGDERQLLIEGTYDPAYSGSYDYDTAQVHYAGDEYPTGYDSGQRDQDSTLAFVAIEDSVEDMPDYGADAVYRDPTGARYDVQILSITDNYDSDRPGRRNSQIKMKRVNDAR